MNAKFKEGYNLLVESWKKHRELQTFLYNKIEEQYLIYNDQDTKDINTSDVNNQILTEREAFTALNDDIECLNSAQEKKEVKCEGNIFEDIYDETLSAPMSVLVKIETNGEVESDNNA